MAGKFSSGSMSRADALGITATPLTIAGWYYLRSSSLSDINFCSLSDGTTSNIFKGKITRGSGLFNCIVCQTTLTNARRGPYNGRWVHLALVFTSSTSRTIYMNGSWNVGDSTNLTPTGLNNWRIGSAPSEGNFSGFMEDVVVYSAALTVQDVRALVNGVRPTDLKKGSLMGWWCADGYRPQIDRSGLGNDMTTISGVTYSPGRRSPDFIKRYGRTSTPITASANAAIDDDGVVFSGSVRASATATAFIDDDALTFVGTVASTATLPPLSATAKVQRRAINRSQRFGVPGVQRHGVAV